MKCKFCEREFKRGCSLAVHEKTCKFNPDRVSGQNQWTKAKENGTEYVISEESRRKRSKSSTGRKHTEETKRKISKSRVKFLRDNPEMVPYKLNHYSKGRSYPEEYWKGIFDAHEIDYVEQYQIGPYQLDFAIVDMKLDIEIDGEQHYLDERIVKSDARRNAYLEAEGWKIIRIRWSEYQKLTKHKRAEFVRNVIMGL